MLRPEIRVGCLYININPRARPRDWVKEGAEAPLPALTPLTYTELPLPTPTDRVLYVDMTLLLHVSTVFLTCNMAVLM